MILKRNGLGIIIFVLLILPLSSCAGNKKKNGSNSSDSPTCSITPTKEGYDLFCTGFTEPVTIKHGADGLPGRNGSPGSAGPKGEKGDGGGEQGPAGKDGAPGTNGKDGAPGATGGRGSDGSPGRNGIDGKPGSPGTQGDSGKDGIPGKDGKPGRDGKDGVNGRIIISVCECHASWPESSGNIDVLYTIFTYSDDTRESTLRLGGRLPNEASSNVFIGTSIVQKTSGDYEFMTVDVHEFTVTLQASGNAYLVYRPNGRNLFFPCRP